ncbi:hypothetical protein BPAE_0161g00210 [Botrytis paeoniae]|uniref:Uncharacterized protein n=1 Tax=Botrytis paeoniae TaxID=278948 RepID=A0A4Z1FDF8_9HELO|nr:hypothetical protein BPAE_0161g00210 [Botrytis paeoniae]
MSGSKPGQSDQSPPPSGLSNQVDPPGEPEGPSKAAENADLNNDQLIDGISALAGFSTILMHRQLLISEAPTILLGYEYYYFDQVFYKITEKRPYDRLAKIDERYDITQFGKIRFGKVLTDIEQHKTTIWYFSVVEEQYNKLKQPSVQLLRVQGQ